MELSGARAARLERTGGAATTGLMAPPRPRRSDQASQWLTSCAACGRDLCPACCMIGGRGCIYSIFLQIDRIPYVAEFVHPTPTGLEGAASLGRPA